MERPANRTHGDWSSNLALAVSKKVGKPARELAEQISGYMNANLPEGVEEVSMAGPGFINFKVTHRCLLQVLIEALEKGPDGFGRLVIG